MFDERRNRGTGIDKSYPLQPISQKTSPTNTGKSVSIKYLKISLKKIIFEQKFVWMLNFEQHYLNIRWVVFLIWSSFQYQIVGINTKNFGFWIKMSFYLAFHQNSWSYFKNSL